MKKRRAYLVSAVGSALKVKKSYKVVTELNTMSSNKRITAPTRKDVTAKLTV